MVGRFTKRISPPRLNSRHPLTQRSPPDVTEKVTAKALEVGYRHVRPNLTTPRTPHPNKRRSTAQNTTPTKRNAPKQSPSRESTAPRSSTRAKSPLA